MRVGYYSLLLYLVEALFGRLSWRGYSDYRPSTPHSPNAATCTILGTDQMNPFRILSVNTTNNRVPPRKANILADALSRSRREELIGSGIVGTEGNSALELVVITRSSIVFTEEIQLWKEVQTKDLAIQATLQ